MSFVETLFTYDPARRELFLAAKKKLSHEPSSRRNHREPHLSHPKPPRRDNGFTRRQFVIGGTAAIGTIVAGSAVAYLFKPWNWFASQPEHQTPETLGSLVIQAKKMEAEFQGQDLANKPLREKYAGILAGISALHYPGYSSRQQLTAAVSWADTLDQFVRQRIASTGKTGIPTASQMEKERSTTASTDSRTKRITVNSAADAYKQRNIPRDWNPLKILRLSLLHEFNHLVTEASDEITFSIVDPTNRYKDKLIEGFRFVAIEGTDMLATSFNDLHEAVVELLAKDLSVAYFGSYLSAMSNEITGDDVSVTINNLERVLQAIGMSHQELLKLHRNSNLRGFFIILADKTGINADAPIENKIRFGSIIAGAIERNNQQTLQKYISQVLSANPTSSQK